MTSQEQYEALCRRHDELVQEYGDDSIAPERADAILEDLTVYELIIFNHPARPIEDVGFGD